MDPLTIDTVLTEGREEEISNPQPLKVEGKRDRFNSTMAYNRFPNIDELIERTNTLERQMFNQLISRQESRNDAVRSGVADTQSNDNSSELQGNDLSGSYPCWVSRQSL